MPIKAEDPRLNIWKDRIERSKKIRKKMLKEVKEYIQFYIGNQWGSRKTTLSEKPVINLIFSHIKTQIPSLYFRNPKWYCRPKGKKEELPQLKIHAKLAEAFLNYYANENLGISLKKQMRLAILDAFFAFGTMKVGYIADFEANPNYGKYNTLGQDEKGNPIYEVDKVSGELMKDDMEEVITNEAFYARRRSPRVMLFDPECEGYFEDGRYIAEEIVKSVQDVKNSKLYENTENLEPSFSVKPGYNLDEKDKEDMPEITEDLERVTLYEIYDLEHDKLIVLAEDHDLFLRDENMPDGIEGSPYEFLRFNEIPDELHPLSDIKNLKPIQEEHNLGRAMIMTHAKRFARKYGYKDGTFPPGEEATEMEKLKDPEDGGFFKYAEEMPIPLEDAKLDPSVYQNFQQTKEDFWKAAGSTEHERGTIERRKTAFEAGKISKEAGIRKEDKKSLTEDFAAGIGAKLLQSFQANLTIEQAVEVAGEVGKGWKNISREDIVGQFTVGVEIGSAAPAIPEFERKDFVGIIEVITRMPPDLVMTFVNFEGLLKVLPRLFPLISEEEVINSSEKVKEMQQLLEQRRQQEQQRKQ